MQGISDVDAGRVCQSIDCVAPVFVGRAHETGHQAAMATKMCGKVQRCVAELITVRPGSHGERQLTDGRS